MELKQIKGFTKYYVGSDGFIYKDYGGTRGMRRLKGMPNSGGYRAIVMVENGYKERYLIHRLVAMYFIPNLENKPYIDHINGNPADNRVENLRWATPKENSNNPITEERVKTTLRERNAVPIVCRKEGIEIRFDNQYIAGNYFKCDYHRVLAVANTNAKLYDFQVFKEKSGQ